MLRRPLSNLFWRQALPGSKSSRSFSNLRHLSELEDSLEGMNFNALHKIVLGFSSANLTVQTELDPTLVNGKDCFGFTPLHWAARRTNLSAILQLLDAGADANAKCKKGSSVLIHAAAGSMTVAELCCRALLDAGADARVVNKHGETALFTTMRTNPVNKNVLTLLLNNGIDVNFQNFEDGKSCLMLAAKYSTADVCELLLDYGADLELMDSENDTAIFHAICFNNPLVVKLFCQRGALLHRSNKYRWDIVHYAALYGDINIMRVLRNARIEGLRMGPREIASYWNTFDNIRGDSFTGERDILGIERAEYQALLDSIVPYTDPEPPHPFDEFDIPGAFPVESETDTDLGEVGST